MTDELTRAIAEALREALPGYSIRGRGATSAEIAAALTPLIEARVREARAEALAQVSEVLDASTAKFDRAVGGPTEPTRFVRDTARNLRNDAEEVRRG